MKRKLMLILSFGISFNSFSQINCNSYRQVKIDSIVSVMVRDSVSLISKVEYLKNEINLNSYKRVLIKDGKVNILQLHSNENNEIHNIYYYFHNDSLIYIDEKHFMTPKKNKEYYFFQNKLICLRYPSGEDLNLSNMDRDILNKDLIDNSIRYKVIFEDK